MRVIAYLDEAESVLFRINSDESRFREQATAIKGKANDGWKDWDFLYCEGGLCKAKQVGAVANIKGVEMGKAKTKDIPKPLLCRRCERCGEWFIACHPKDMQKLCERCRKK